LINEFGTPENPKPPTRIVVPAFMSLIASEAEEQILFIARRAVKDENSRLEHRARLADNREALIVAKSSQQRRENSKASRVIEKN
jgi:hypothetical protein